MKQQLPDPHFKTGDRVYHVCRDKISGDWWIKESFCSVRKGSWYYYTTWCSNEMEKDNGKHRYKTIGDALNGFIHTAIFLMWLDRNSRNGIDGFTATALEQIQDILGVAEKARILMLGKSPSEWGSEYDQTT